MPKPELPSDLVSELLLGMRLRGIAYRRIQLSPPLGVEFGTAAGWAQFHFVARGPVYLRSPSGSVHTLSTGDALLLPRGGPHALLSSPDQPAQDVTAFESARLCEAVSAIRACPKNCTLDGALTFSGCMEFDLGSMHALVSLMPEVMYVGTLLERQPEILPMLEAMEREARSERAGYAAILARLADVMAAFIVRGWVECGCGDASGWIEALRDPRLGRVIAALHREPGRNWTVAELAAEMGSSRSVFAERFLAVTGMTPHRYVTELRMRLAAQWIGRERQPIESVAYRLGYGSAAAFSRAFKRIHGHPPGALRQQHEARTDAPPYEPAARSPHERSPVATAGH
ncbi:AraC family transcriptional regulator [Billgrantia tianxiuensis]|jgi:AraC-like DNA-binding protein|uniref:AraC family transcriptional regulator n=1 Tax=Billgrantia tianxiuensis TaxID=2497861 RepID=A0A6I6SNQ8_9GAMM|nr:MULTISPECIES: AraC family transcriptional regulator [Halomonas]MCE8033242.1 AraC family transcriptional regulator [Halomonas sp. MCCC 1A11057]QHC48985.1 AraC family transcriptional regulator [Halomonas tianxiuensis]